MITGRTSTGREQDQFLEVIDRDEAERRFHAVLELRPLGEEQMPLAEALGRVLARDVAAPVDVPFFDRSNVDGYAVRAADTFGAMEEQPRRLEINDETLATGVVPRLELSPGTATVIATGGMLPRGADAVVMVEYTAVEGDDVKVFRPVVPGANVTFAGSDIGRGQIVLRRAELLSSRETGVLAALGIDRVPVFRRPRVAILSTGDEIIAPGQPIRPGLVFDSNATIVADAVRELGGEPVPLGIVGDDETQLREMLQTALQHDIVLLSGGTSKGAGDLSYRVVSKLPPPVIKAQESGVRGQVSLVRGQVSGVRGQVSGVRASSEVSSFNPEPTATATRLLSPAVAVGSGLNETGKSAILAHGVALKPGKPICLAATCVSPDRSNVPVVILPGFPTSAIFTFHEFVAPVIRALAGRRREPAGSVTARMPVRVNSERGRTEYLLVGLVDGPRGLAAYPMGKGSGSVTAFSRADGFVTIPRQQELLEEDSAVTVQLLGRTIEPADLVAIGSHCVGLDMLLGLLHERGFRVKSLCVGSTGGLVAARRGECDLAGIHLLDAATDTYNAPFLTPDLELVKGYARMQGFVFRPDDERFRGRNLDNALAAALADPACRMVNRNRGSGTRVLIDRLLAGKQPPGFYVEVKSHNAVVAAVAQGRADWGIAIETVARDAGLGFIPLREEEFDFAIPKSRLARPAVQAFLDLLQDPATRHLLARQGFRSAPVQTQ
jgi:putative molybdopterin biosynthesis protein